jgi:hypothetical protein
MPPSPKGEFKLDFLIYVTGCTASIDLLLQVYTELVSVQSFCNPSLQVLAEGLSTQRNKAQRVCGSASHFIQQIFKYLSLMITWQGTSQIPMPSF